MNELLYDHQKALLQFQHSSPPEERGAHWPKVVLAARKLKEWREASGVLAHGLPEGTTSLGNKPMAHFDFADVHARDIVNEWENEGGALAHHRSTKPASDFIVISADQFIVGQANFDNLLDALAYTQRN